MMDKEKFSELAVEGYTVVPFKQKIQTQYHGIEFEFFA